MGCAPLTRRRIEFPVSGFLFPVFHSLLHPIYACPECGSRLRLIATITDTPARGFRRAGSSVIDKILTHLGLPPEAPAPMPAKVAGWLPGVEPAADRITE